MTIHFTIPVWVLWVIGVPLGIVILILLAFGVWAVRFFWDWTPLG